MNRRKFISIIGLAPLAACTTTLPAVATPKSAKLIRASVTMDHDEILFFEDGRLFVRSARLNNGASFTNGGSDQVAEDIQGVSK